jgi:hypothetical protein
MRAVIQVLNGPRSGNKVMLRPGQLLVIGRTQWADVAFKSDPQMSGKHFALEFQSGRLQCRDLESANGTFINGQPAQEAWLQDGDEITAGETMLAISLVGGQPAPEVEEIANPNRPAARIVAQTAAPTPPPAITEITYQREVCGSGLTRMRGGKFGAAFQPPSAGVLANQLAAVRPLTLVVHPQLIERPELVDLPEAVPLFDWLPTEHARLSSPLILTATACPDIPQLIDSAWDKNAMLCIFSQQANSDLVRHLQSALRLRETKADSEGEIQPDVPQVDAVVGAETPSVDQLPPDALLGYCWPKVLSAMLETSSKQLTRRLLAGIDAVLMEIPEESETWQIVCEPDFAATLTGVGLREMTAVPNVL